MPTEAKALAYPQRLTYSITFLLTWSACGQPPDYDKSKINDRSLRSPFRRVWSPSAFINPQVRIHLLNIRSSLIRRQHLFGVTYLVHDYKFAHQNSARHQSIRQPTTDKFFMNFGTSLSNAVELRSIWSPRRVSVSRLKLVGEIDSSVIWAVTPLFKIDGFMK